MASTLHLKTASLQLTVRLGIKEVHFYHTNTLVFEIFIFCFMSLVRTSKNTGVMFLTEVALGNECTITEDYCSLKKAPAGYDSVVARGSVEPGTILPLFYLSVSSISLSGSLIPGEPIPYQCIKLLYMLVYLYNVF